MWLDTLVEATRERVDAGFYDARPDEPLPRPKGTPERPSLKAAIERARPALLAEIKPARPEGPVREVDVAEQAARYAAGGACGISVLTDPDHFGGSLENLARARTAGLPVLMKDFLIDPRQVDAAAAWGASAVLVIARLHLEERTPWGLEEAIATLHAHDLEALVEVVTEAELDAALAADADAIGVNARDLDTLEMDPDRTRRLLAGRELGIPALHFSGVEGPEDVRTALEAGADGVLVGTSVMEAEDPTAKLAELAGVAP